MDIVIYIITRQDSKEIIDSIYTDINKAFLELLNDKDSKVELTKWIMHENGDYILDYSFNFQPLTYFNFIKDTLEFSENKLFIFEEAKVGKYDTLYNIINIKRRKEIKDKMDLIKKNFKLKALII